MSQGRSKLGFVGTTIQDLLPRVNEGFNWGLIKERYDNHPEGTAMSLHLTGDRGQEPIEEIYMGLAEGPRIVILDQLTDDWDYIGAVTMYQDSGAAILNPDNELTPDMARYRDGTVDIATPEGKSSERVWMVVSNVLDIMLNSLIHNGGIVDGEETGSEPAKSGGDD